MAQFKRGGRPIGSYARHYYGLYQLSQHSEVLAMLKPDEYAAIKVDYDRISRSYFPKSYFHSPDMRFSASDALFPTGVLAAQITAEFDTQCRLLCYGSPPKWVEVQERLLQLRDLL